MVSLLSPGIKITEIDLTNVVPTVSTTQAAYVGQDVWGPLNTIMLMDTEKRLVSTFGKPNNTTAQDWFCAANFLAYGDLLWKVRVGHETDANSAATIKNATAANSHGFLIKNNEDYEGNYNGGQLKSQFGCGDWVAKYAGDLGNSLAVSVCSSAEAYQSTLSGTLSVTANTNIVSGTLTSFDDEVTPGDLLVLGGDIYSVATVANSTSLTLTNNHLVGVTGATVTRRWKYYASVNVAPGTSDMVKNVGGSEDEMHIVVTDYQGKWTGQKDTVLEVFQFVSQGSDATKEDGTTNYYVDIINQGSQYIRWAGHNTLLPKAGSSVYNIGFVNTNTPINYTLIGGNDGLAIDESDRIRGWSLFQDKEVTNVDIIIGGAPSQTLAVWLISNLVERRKDCIMFMSPPKNTVVNNLGLELNSVVAFRNSLPSSSYAAIDCNWKYQYDRYNSINRWLPCSPDVAGIHVASDEARDAWWAAAGLNRGQMKNVIKLGWLPSNSDRDILYPNGVNPVVTFPNGKGTYLWGQKTMLSKPSAFDRINVRRLFLVLEKAIGEMAKYFLFEFNDAITRAQIVNTIEPFLANVKGRRGIYDFKVVCDSTNNTPYIIDTNQLNCDIYIQPARAAEFINLTFIATATGVAFSTVIGKF